MGLSVYMSVKFENFSLIFIYKTQLYPLRFFIAGGTNDLNIIKRKIITRVFIHVRCLFMRPLIGHIIGANEWWSETYEPVKLVL